MTSPDLTSPPPPPPPRRLMRSASDRMVAGVAGGIAKHFDLDPALVRIGFAVLSFFGGIGLALYAVCALVVPSEEGAPATAGKRKVALAIIVIAAVISFPFAGPGVFLVGPGLVVLLAVGALGVLGWRAVGGETDSRLLRAALLVLSLTGAIALGVGAAVAAAFGGGAWVAGAVIVAGIVLIVGGFLGGARWLIVPALLMAIPVSVVSAADLDLEGGVGEREYRPASVSDVRPSYRLGAGKLRLDLRGVGFERGTTTALRLRLGMGELRLTVPDDVCVRTSAHVGAGAADLLGRVSEGIDVDVDHRPPPVGGAPELIVDARVGLGEIVVDHEDRDGGGRFGFRHDDEDFESQAACSPA